MTDKETIKVLECCSKEICTECVIGICPNDITDETLNLIKKQQEEIENLKEENEDLKLILDLRSKRKYYKRFLEEVYYKQKGTELCSPDFDYIYKLYFQQREEISSLKHQIEILKKINHTNDENLYHKFKANIKDEIIKEITEEFKTKADYFYYFYQISEKDFDEMVKKMTGEEK